MNYNPDHYTPTGRFKFGRFTCDCGEEVRCWVGSKSYEQRKCHKCLEV